MRPTEALQQSNSSCRSSTSTSRSSSFRLGVASFRRAWTKKQSNRSAATSRPPEEIAVDAVDERGAEASVRDILSLLTHDTGRPESTAEQLSTVARVIDWIFQPIGFALFCAIMAVLWQHRLPRYVVVVFLVHGVTKIMIKWRNYFASQTDVLVAWRQRQGLLRILDRHSDLVVNGHYIRRVFTGYFLYNLTQPGKTFLNESVRRRTKDMNQSLVSELSGRHRRRLSSIRIVNRNRMDDDYN